MKLFKNKKSIAMLVSIIALLTIVAGTTIAYLYTNTPSITNTFTPTKVTTTIVEDDPSDTKNNVKVKNTGDIDAYIRATVIVTWKDASGQVHATAPVAGTDYEVTYPTDTGWVEGSDGYYYYTSKVAAGGSTGVLLTDCKPVGGKTPAGYHLSVEILASAIQAEPSDAVTTAWGSTNGGSVTGVDSSKNLVVTSKSST